MTKTFFMFAKPPGGGVGVTVGVGLTVIEGTGVGVAVGVAVGVGVTVGIAVGIGVAVGVGIAVGVGVGITVGVGVKVAVGTNACGLNAAAQVYQSVDLLRVNVPFCIPTLLAKTSSTPSVPDDDDMRFTNAIP